VYQLEQVHSWTLITCADSCCAVCRNVQCELCFIWNKIATVNDCRKYLNRDVILFNILDREQNLAFYSSLYDSCLWSLCKLLFSFVTYTLQEKAASPNPNTLSLAVHVHARDKNIDLLTLALNSGEAYRLLCSPFCTRLYNFFISWPCQAFGQAVLLMHSDWENC